MLIDRLNPTRRAQMDSLLEAKTGDRMLIILAGGFPANEIIQAAFLALGENYLPGRMDVLNQLLHDDQQCSDVIKAANLAHRHTKNPTLHPERSIKLPRELVKSIISHATIFKPHLSSLPEILNSYDISSRLESNQRVAEAFLRLDLESL